MFKRKYIDIPPGTIFYPSIGPYRSLFASHKYIVDRKATYNFDEAIKYCYDFSIEEEAKGVFIKDDTALNGYTEVCRDDDGKFYTVEWI